MSIDDKIQEEGRITRRSFLKDLAVIVGGLALSPLIPSSAEAKTRKEITIHGKTYTLDYVNNVVSKNQRKELSVRDYLKQEGIEEVTVDNYKEKVYGSDKPVIVMPYSNEDFIGFDIREAIILKLLKEQFGDKIQFYAIDVTVDKGKAECLAGSEISKFMDNYSKYIKKREQPEAPSLLLYSPYDILKGETPENNDGKMKLIDVLRKGPRTNDDIFAALYNLINYAFGPNLKLRTNKEHEIYRLFNTYRDYVEISKLLKN